GGSSNGSYAGRSAQPGMSSARYAARTNGSERRAAEVCSDDAAQLTNLPLERISEVVQPTDAQRPALDELRAASAKAIDMLKAGCPKDPPAPPPGALGGGGGGLEVLVGGGEVCARGAGAFLQTAQRGEEGALNPHRAGRKSRRRHKGPA